MRANSKQESRRLRGSRQSRRVLVLAGAANLEPRTPDVADRRLPNRAGGGTVGIEATSSGE